MTKKLTAGIALFALVVGLGGAAAQRPAAAAGAEFHDMCTYAGAFMGAVGGLVTGHFLGIRAGHQRTGGDMIGGMAIGMIGTAMAGRFVCWTGMQLAARSANRQTGLNDVPHKYLLTSEFHSGTPLTGTPHATIVGHTISPPQTTEAH